jgi:hypothetical protein
MEDHMATQIDYTKVRLNRSQKLITKPELAKMPGYLGQDGKGDNAIVLMHFFMANYDFWVLEFDQENGEFFGYGGFSNMPDCYELGFASVDEWVSLGRVERDLYWTPKTLGELKKGLR